MSLSLRLCYMRGRNIYGYQFPNYVRNVLRNRIAKRYVKEIIEISRRIGNIVSGLRFVGRYELRGWRGKR